MLSFPPPALPIDAILPDLCATLATHGRVVLQAPPGAGKTTRVPLALMDQVPGKIIMLEPRRLAARGAALRLAQTLGETLGNRVGYRMRGDAQAGSKIEVVTEGILTRMLQSDPELPGIGALIFDEFHERSLNADLGLALAWEVRQALREDLQLVVMSATLDAAPVAKLLDDAPILTSEGRAFPVTTHHLPQPRGKDRLEPFVAQQIVSALDRFDGSILVFLPGEGEIRRTLAALPDRVGVTVCPLYGALPFADQQKAIKPAQQGRKVVLATSIAETSLTIEGIRVVIDAGLSRRARFDPGSGMSRLVTDRVTRAEATQRSGRAGRVAPGDALRLWTKGEEGALLAYPPAEIEAADLTGLALELAQWGAHEDTLAFLTPPPAPALAEARALLTTLGALDARGSLTDHGAALARLPLHPRLGHMLLKSGPKSAPLAALLSSRDPVQSRDINAALRLEAIRDTQKFRHARNLQIRDGALKQIKEDTKRLHKLAGSATDITDAQAAALAYPDRIAMRRKGDAPRYLMSGGKGSILPDTDPLAGSPFLVALDTDGHPREAKVRLALSLSEADIHTLFADQITEGAVCTWSKREGRVLARWQTRLGALVLDDKQLKSPEPDAMAQAMCTGIRQIGLCLDPVAERFRARVARARDGGLDLPDLSDQTLLDTLEDWLLPHLASVNSAEKWRNMPKLTALKAMLDWPQSQSLDQAFPENFRTPLNRSIPIDYASEPPEISLRLQELFGQTTHPMIAGQPLLITLLSPAGRPVQTTADLPGFWSGSYADVRKDMRARYPKHPWPEDPTQADPTLRRKPR